MMKMDYFKVMFTDIEDEVIWNTSTEKGIQLNHRFYGLLNKEINITNWKDEYYKLYLDWLHNDNESIYDINHPINLNMINALIKVNQLAFEFKIYYWFDVNRDKYPEFVWNVCPLSGTPLIALANSFHINNKKISSVFPLIFPSME